MEVRKGSMEYNAIITIIAVLVISNLIFFGWVVVYFIQNHPPMDSMLSAFENLAFFISSIIVLGFITTRLPQFRGRFNNSLYELSLLVLMGMVSILMTTFEQYSGISEYISPYLDIFTILSVALILLLILTKTKALKGILHGKRTRKSTVYCLLFFLILAAITSAYYVPIHSSVVNVKEFIVIIAGLIGGPYVGIPVGLFAGAERFVFGGPTALSGTLSVIIAGIISSVVFICNGGKLPTFGESVGLMCLYPGFSMLLTVVATPQNISIPYILDIYPLMLVSCVLGVVVFLLIISEQKKGSPISDDDFRINELELALEDYENRVDKLEEEIEILKRKNSDDDL